MRLSRFPDYAVRVLMYSAMHSERLVTLHELSSFYDISLAHLRKVVHKLGKLGYLKTARGKGGGLRLQQTAESINIGVVVAEFEGRAPLVDCSSQSCVILPACALPRALRRAQTAFYKELECYSLADIVRQEKFSCVIDAVSTRKAQKEVIAFS